MMQISLKCVTQGPFNNITELVQIWTGGVLYDRRIYASYGLDGFRYPDGCSDLACHSYSHKNLMGIPTLPVIVVNGGGHMYISVFPGYSNYLSNDDNIW